MPINNTVISEVKNSIPKIKKKKKSKICQCKDLDIKFTARNTYIVLIQCQRIQCRQSRSSCFQNSVRVDSSWVLPRRESLDLLLSSDSHLRPWSLIRELSLYFTFQNAHHGWLTQSCKLLWIPSEGPALAHKFHHSDIQLRPVGATLRNSYK